MLEEVEVPPLVHARVVYGAIGRAARRTREATAACKIDLDVEALAGHVEGTRLDHPRRHQPERQLKQIDITHGKLLVPVRIDLAIVLAAVKAKPSRARDSRAALTATRHDGAPSVRPGRKNVRVAGRTKE